MRIVALFLNTFRYVIEEPFQLYTRLRKDAKSSAAFLNVISWCHVSISSPQKIT